MGRHPGQALNAEQRTRPSRRSFLDMLPTLLSGLTVAAILGIGGLRVIEGSLTLGGLVAFQSLMASFSEPITRWSTRSEAFRSSRAGSSGSRTCTTIRSIMRPRPAAADGSVSRRSWPDRIELSNVQFGYSILEPPLISGLSISVKPGDPRGTGRPLRKRKIDARPADLRALQAWDGEIRIDGSTAVPRSRPKCSQTPSPMWTRTFSCSKERRATT